MEIVAKRKFRLRQKIAKRVARFMLKIVNNKAEPETRSANTSHGHQRFSVQRRVACKEQFPQQVGEPCLGQQVRQRTDERRHCGQRPGEAGKDEPGQRIRNGKLDETQLCTKKGSKAQSQGCHGNHIDSACQHCGSNSCL